MENIYNLFPNLINILSKIPDCKKYKYLILFINEKEFYIVLDDEYSLKYYARKNYDIYISYRKSGKILKFLGYGR